MAFERHSLKHPFPYTKKKKKKKKKKKCNSPNMMPFFTGPLPVQCVGGRRPGIFADATQDCSTSEDFSPRTVLTKNICRCVHHILKHFPTTMRFLTVSAITYSWMASIAAQASTHQRWCWWFGHVGSWWWPISRTLQAPDWRPRHLLTENHGEESAQEWHSKTFNSPNMMPFPPAPRRTTCRLGHF